MNLLSCMSGLILLSLCSVAPDRASAAQASSGWPNMAGTEGVTTLLHKVAFDTDRFFQSKKASIGIVYTGDDYNWPVYGIGIVRGCTFPDVLPLEQCRGAWRARMVRVPQTDMESPRLAAARFVRRLADEGAHTLEAMDEAVIGAGLQWLEADIKTCPGAEDHIAKVTQIDWVPREAIEEPSRDMPRLVLHADKLTVTFQKHLWNATFHGWIGDGSPAVWGKELADRLEPCWRPARVRAPWPLN